MRDSFTLSSRALAYLAMTHIMISHGFHNVPAISFQRRSLGLNLSRKGNRNPKFKKSIDSPSYASRSRPQVNDIIDSINSPPSFPYSVDPNDVPPGTVQDDPLAPLVHAIVHAADMRKASNIVAMRVTPVTSMTEFIVILTGTSRPQNQAIANSIMKDVEEQYQGKRCLGKGVPEGTAESGWILLDYGEVMVHIMTPKSRLFYDIEGQWKKRGGEYMDLSNVLIEEINSSLADPNGNYDLNLNPDEIWTKESLDGEKENDPFWS